MLRTAFGPAIARFLDDPDIVEVMLNPDGRLWIDRLSSGLTDTAQRLSAPDGERIVRLVAHHVRAEVHAGTPRVSAELPETGERFEGLLPPVVAAPAFAIRKPAVAVFALDDYVAAGIMSSDQAHALRGAQVTENVDDTPTGRVRLIPQGARLIDVYDSQVAFGQSRVLLVGTRLIMPNGRSIVLERQPGADAAGYAGLEDDVDYHWTSRLRAWMR
jgi:type IV secretory pathway ATPase VirB11/archaellum biosynthesis ATPase